MSSTKYDSFIIYYMNRTPSTKKQEREREKQTDSRVQSSRGQIIHNVRKIADGERNRQA